MADFTRGEWTSRKMVDDWGIYGPNDRRLAQVHHDIDAPEQVEANARLISSAPSMYEALVEIYDAPIGADTMRAIMPWLDKVEKIIAKLEGKQ